MSTDSSNKHLTMVVYDKGLLAYINPDHESIGDPLEKNLIVDTVEAIVGAVWYDNGSDFATVASVAHNLRSYPGHEQGVVQSS
ncbi:hypothetical protein NA57DRAFT_75208 [Rhizodiscina lignyota]|uniref:RNase III domain-containing protein n=1 Tax=Rhizodiscina lignyota TaxID=1504668 RepID=A0A9P4IEZ1_9PEZI|nr:hypothetical protein NA57DRAFT_75208 [Rhizodiscina lignyota]